MKKMLALLLAMALFAVACGDDSPNAADDPAPASDPAPDPENEAGAERIISLSATATEILFAIGAGDQVVAVDSYSNYPEDAPVSDIEAFTPNVEAIAAFEPDLITMQSNAAAVDLEALGITVLQRDAPASFDEIYTQIEELGAATGHIAEAAALVLEMQTDIAELQAGLPDASELTYYHELGTDLYSVTSATFIGEVYALFGITNIADAADPDGALGGYPQLSEEFVLDADPDLIFLADTIFAEQSAETVAARPGWAELTAVKTGGVVELDDDIASRWGPRVVEFAEAIAQVIAAVVPAS